MDEQQEINLQWEVAVTVQKLCEWMQKMVGSPDITKDELVALPNVIEATANLLSSLKR